MAKLHVLIPGLLGPMAELKDSTQPLPAFKHLSQYLTRAELHEVVKGYLPCLASLLGLQENISAAKISADYDNIPTNGCIMRADPVHFKAEMDHAVLLDQHRLAIYPEEAKSLVASFNQHFKDDGLRLEFSEASRWYLHFSQNLKLQTTSLSQAIARNVHNFLPQGEDARRWRQILNEAQMLFYAHEVNQRREAAGQLSINSLWLWGEGDDLHTPATQPIDWIMANEPLVCGLAQHLHIPLQPLLADFSHLSGDGLMVLDHIAAAASYGDVAAWLDELEIFSQQWLPVLMASLKAGQFSEIVLQTDVGKAFYMQPRSCYKFWRQGHWGDFVVLDSK